MPLSDAAAPEVAQVWHLRHGEAIGTDRIRTRIGRLRPLLSEFHRFRKANDRAIRLRPPGGVSGAG